VVAFSQVQAFWRCGDCVRLVACGTGAKADLALQFFATYTWSDAIDDAPEQNSIDSANTVTLSDPSDRRRDRGQLPDRPPPRLEPDRSLHAPIPREQQACQVSAKPQPPVGRHGRD